MIKGWYYLRNPKVRISQKPLDRRRAEWKSSERIRFVKVKSTPYLMVEFSLLKWNLRFQSTIDGVSSESCGGRDKKGGHGSISSSALSAPLHLKQSVSV